MVTYLVRGLGALLPAMLCLAPAVAQSDEPRPARKVEIGLVCAKAIERFCPALAGTAEPRNQVICLKPFRSSLTLPCRRAVTAELQGPLQ